jgi:hypothetical protein
MERRKEMDVGGRRIACSLKMDGEAGSSSLIN